MSNNEMQAVNFADNTINSTPLPRATSTVERRGVPPKPRSIMEESEKIESDFDESLGIMSIKSQDIGPFQDNSIDFQVPERDSSSYIQEQRLLARKSLQNQASKITALPSRFLRPSELTQDCSEGCLTNNDESTINESDLMRCSIESKETGKRTPNTSTPRNSLEFTEQNGRFSIADSLSRLSCNLENPEMSLSKIVEQFQHTKDIINNKTKDISFVPAEEAEKKFLADEKSWRREKDILPVENNPSDLSGASVFDMSGKSIGEFFKKRSDDLSQFYAANISNTTKMDTSSSTWAPPEKYSMQPDSSSGFYSSDNYTRETNTDKSLSISQIAKLLQDTDDTPSKVMNYLYNQRAKESPSRNSTQKDSLASRNLSLGSIKSPDKTVNNKENYNTTNLMSVPSRSDFCLSNINKSVDTLRSTSSLSCLPNGKLPIETNQVELVWGCLKPGKSSTQHFILRNKSANRLRLQATIKGPLFKIIKDRSDQDPPNVFKFVLHQYETKSISIEFSPLSIGAAISEINFTSVDPNLQQTKKQAIGLFGYGGNGTLEFTSNIFKDISRHILSLGSLNGRESLEQTFVIRNSGTLPIFVLLNYVPKDALTFTKISVVPNIFVVLPQQQTSVTVTCTPSKEDCAFLEKCTHKSSVLDIGAIKMMSGEEAIRGRIRRLCRKQIEKEIEVEPIVKILSETIPGEIIPNDCANYKESTSALKTLLQNLNRNAISVTIEHDLDRTLVTSLPEDSSFFQSFSEQTVIMNQSLRNLSIKVEPSVVYLTPPIKTEDFFFLMSEESNPLPFHIVAPEGFEVHPSKGILKFKSLQSIKLSYANISSKRLDFDILVSVNSDVFHVGVKVMFLD